jgi:hypothetical protein
MHIIKLDLKAHVIDRGETISVRCSLDSREVDGLTLSQSDGKYLSVDALRLGFVDYDKVEGINCLSESDSNIRNSRFHHGEYQRIMGTDVKLISNVGIKLKSSSYRVHLTEVPSNKSQVSKMVYCLMFVPLVTGVILYVTIVNFQLSYEL